MKKLIIIGILMMLLLTGINIEAGCYSPYLTPNILDGYQASSWSTPVNACYDDNTGTFTASAVNGSWIQFHDESLWDVFGLAGIRVMGREKYKFGYVDLIFDVEVDGTSEGQITCPNGLTWGYLNFSTLYDYDDSVNLSFVQTQTKGSGEFYEIDFIWVYKGAVSHSNLYPTHVDDCVPIYPNITGRCNFGGTLQCSMWTNASLWSNVTGSWVMYEYTNQTYSGPITLYHQFKEMNQYNTRYYWRLVGVQGGGEYSYEEIENRTYYFDTEICEPPEGIPPLVPYFYGSLLDCFEMVSLPVNETVSIYDSQLFF